MIEQYFFVRVDNSKVIISSENTKIQFFKEVFDNMKLYWSSFGIRNSKMENVYRIL